MLDAAGMKIVKLLTVEPIGLLLVDMGVLRSHQLVVVLRTGFNWENRKINNISSPTWNNKKMDKKDKLTRNWLQFFQHVKWRRLHIGGIQVASRTERHQSRRMVLRSRRERWKRCRWWREHEVVVRRMVGRAGWQVKTGVGIGGWRRRRNEWTKRSVLWRRKCWIRRRLKKRVPSRTGRIKGCIQAACFSSLLPPQVFLLTFQASSVVVVWRKYHVEAEIKKLA